MKINLFNSCFSYIDLHSSEEKSIINLFIAQFKDNQKFLSVLSGGFNNVILTNFNSPRFKKFLKSGYNLK
jgi:hypothetical protein